MDITLNDAILGTQDHLANYTTSTIDPGQKKRQINRAIEYIKRRFGMPSDETIFSFLFCEDQNFYDLPEDFDESFLLKYRNDAYNIPQYKWDYYTYAELFKVIGNAPGFMYAVTTINGRKQLMVVGQNVVRGQLLDSCETISTWAASGDASGLVVDSLQKYAGSASLSFDITRSTGVATLKKTGLALNLTDLFSKHGYIKLWNDMTATGVDSVSLKLITTTGAYYTITVDTADNGDAFSIDEFIKLGFPMDDALKTGAADYGNITQIEIDWNLNIAFVSAADFRIDQIFTVIPDQMDLIYYSSYKGTDANTSAQKIMLTDETDIITIASMFPDALDIICRRAAINMWFSFNGSRDAYTAFKQEFDDITKAWNRSFPRKRTMNNALRHVLQRSSS